MSDEYDDIRAVRHQCRYLVKLDLPTERRRVVECLSNVMERWGAMNDDEYFGLDSNPPPPRSKSSSMHSGGATSAPQVKAPQPSSSATPPPTSSGQGFKKKSLTTSSGTVPTSSGGGFKKKSSSTSRVAQTSSAPAGSSSSLTSIAVSGQGGYDYHHNYNRQQSVQQGHKPQSSTIDKWTNSVSRPMPSLSSSKKRQWWKHMTVEMRAGNQQLALEPTHVSFYVVSVRKNVAVNVLVQALGNARLADVLRELADTEFDVISHGFSPAELNPKRVALTDGHGVHWDINASVIEFVEQRAPMNDKLRLNVSVVR